MSNDASVHIGNVVESLRTCMFNALMHISNYSFHGIEAVEYLNYKESPIHC